MKFRVADDVNFWSLAGASGSEAIVTQGAGSDPGGVASWPAALEGDGPEARTAPWKGHGEARTAPVELWFDADLVPVTLDGDGPGARAGSRDGRAIAC